MARGKGDTGKAVVLSSAEIKRLLKIAGTTMHGERDRTVITLSYWLGLRAKELAALKVGDVYTDTSEIKPVLHLKAGYTKRAKVRDVYLSASPVVKRLEEYLISLTADPRFARASAGAARSRRNLNGSVGAKAPPVFSDQALSLPLFRTRTGRGFSANGMVHLLKHLHGLAGIEGGSSHSGRRTMITRLAESGVDLKSIATLAGHSSIRTTAGYVEDNPERLSKIMGSVDLL